MDRKALDSGTWGPSSWAHPQKVVFCRVSRVRAGTQAPEPLPDSMGMAPACCVHRQSPCCPGRPEVRAQETLCPKGPGRFYGTQVGLRMTCEGWDPVSIPGAGPWLRCQEALAVQDPSSRALPTSAAPAAGLAPAPCTPGGKAPPLHLPTG